MSGITGATFVGDRLFLAGQGGGFQVWSIDLSTGARQLELERPYTGTESEGLDLFTGLGGTLHWLVQPFGAMPTFGIGGGALVHFVPANTLRARLRIAPRRARAGVRRRFVFRADFRVQGRRKELAGAKVRFAGRHARTDDSGKATIRVRLRRGRHVARVSKRGIRPGRAVVRTRQ
jgi:hypothetical protein